MPKLSITNYEEMLERALAQLPKKTIKSRRFTIPEPECLIVGNRTFLNNFKSICDMLNRNPRHLLKFLLRELATAGSASGQRAVFQGRFDRAIIKNLCDQYVKEFVLCPICHRPDTKIEKRKRFTFLICEACGAQSSVRTI
jgi:translation initiation factor 2 subunit 2